MGNIIKEHHLFGGKDYTDVAKDNTLDNWLTLNTYMEIN